MRPRLAVIVRQLYVTRDDGVSTDARAQKICAAM
jgi:hypothetical protein